MLLVTGGAGFIGSNVVAALEGAGRDVVVNDVLGGGAKWRNLAKRRIADFVPPTDLDRWLAGRRLDGVVHMGAISATTATDADLVIDTNFRLSLRLLDWCTATRTPFVYASSAATYGAGEGGFLDGTSPEALAKLRPLNLYGWSKHLFDREVAARLSAGRDMPPVWAGLKFFNVFGPNEYHKGDMASIVAKLFPEIKRGSPVKLFKSHRDGIADGDQRRDFIYVDDAVAAVMAMLERPSGGGIYNVGTGVARSFRELVSAVFTALDLPPNIEYVDMPTAIRPNYQYFTQADMNALRSSGFGRTSMRLEDSVRIYVREFLDREDPYR